ncbi:phage protease XkdF family protein [Anoxybacillus sp. B7M1]|uniref:XkdF-like putative serine protease domain-containing protein n=1 Tax=unclassified Anoxybacillus TaxID=2639704 RepID=UPI0005CCCA86|nr:MULTISPECIES: XkdF-like putative serine protease domain-containing protein [unclassified Anoxybacillus]ANB56362.1 phage protease XkdF family protein [Anoxybacillus sp. B2M1]ANB64210.1 phage protease XkdF family protein [Anoxybacillus sp. B7M1]
MPRELKNAHITHVSYVDKGANKKQFFLTKSEEKPTFQKEVKVFVNKEEEEQKLVYGVVYEPDAVDSHGDFMTAAEIEKAAHGFLKDARNIDKQHDFNPGVGEVVESYIAPTDFTIGNEEIKKGSWVLVTKASDEIWEQIKKGEITGYSMAGTAEVVDVQKGEKPITQTSSDDDEVKGFFYLVKNFFTGKTDVQKGAVKDKYEQRSKANRFWVAIDSFESVLRRYNWQTDEYEFENDETKIREAIQDLSDILIDLLASENIAKAVGKPPEKVEKAGKKISAANMQKIKEAHAALAELVALEEEEEEEVKKEDIEKLLDEKLSAITKRLDEIEKGEGVSNQGEGQQSGEDDIAKQLGEILDAKLDPIMKRLDAVEKARGISKQADQDPPSPQQTDVQKGYMRLFQ